MQYNIIYLHYVRYIMMRHGVSIGPSSPAPVVVAAPAQLRLPSDPSDVVRRHRRARRHILPARRLQHLATWHEPFGPFRRPVFSAHRSLRGVRKGVEEWDAPARVGLLA